MTVKPLLLDTKILKKSESVKVFFHDKGRYFDEDAEVTKKEIDNSKAWVLFDIRDKTL